MTINFPTTPMIKISSTSTLSLNSRFTDMMDKRSKSGKAGRKAVFDSDYEDLDDEPVVKTERVSFSFKFPIFCITWKFYISTKKKL